MTVSQHDHWHSIPGELICGDWIPRPVDEVFSFFSDPYNLERITPPFLRFRVSATTDDPVRQGTLIDYRLRLHGVPIRWRTRIEEWLPQQRFVDRQLSGPYKLWHHTHDFEAYDGGTRIRDHVRYQLPFGRIGTFVAGSLVLREINEIFLYRRNETRNFFGASEPG